ncbi:hypothetical protein QE152_g29243 [Popillia japonica]|uniref:Uncharacterized protein n=1 Tax=Popillia japonica TaxID=7064 RepID=A0AAW1JJR6_POPJA
MKVRQERKLRKDLLLLNKRLKAKTDYEGSSEESEIEVVYTESDGSLSFCQESTSEDDTSSGTEFLIGDLVLVKFSTKKTTKYYVGQIKEIENHDDYRVKFLRKKTDSQLFYYPDIEDMGNVTASDIMKLRPKQLEGTARTSSLILFSVNLSLYNVY